MAVQVAPWLQVAVSKLLEMILVNQKRKGLPFSVWVQLTIPLFFMCSFDSLFARVS